MAPFLVSLFKAGMPVLANAVLAKGKEVVEEKLGVNIEELTRSEAGLIRLKEIEMENEDSLREFTLATREQELRSDKMYLDDVDSARKMQIAALEQDDKFAKRFIYWFAIFWSIMSCVYIGFITFGTIPDDNIRFADTILGFILGTLVATIINFFFGSAKGSKDKDANLAAAIKGLTK